MSIASGCGTAVRYSDVLVPHLNHDSLTKHIYQTKLDAPLPVSVPAANNAGQAHGKRAL